MESPESVALHELEALRQQSVEVRPKLSKELLRSLDRDQRQETLWEFEEFLEALRGSLTDDDRRRDALDTLLAAKHALEEYSAKHPGFDQFQYEVTDVLRRFASLSEST